MHGEVRATSICIERPVEVLGSHRGCLHGLDRARVCEENVDITFRACDFLIEVIEILQLGYVTVHGYDIFADFLRGVIQLRLSPPRNENERSFGNETLGRGEGSFAQAS